MLLQEEEEAAAAAFLCSLKPNKITSPNPQMNEMTFTTNTPKRQRRWCIDIGFPILNVGTIRVIENVVAWMYGFKLYLFVRFGSTYNLWPEITNVWTHISMHCSILSNDKNGFEMKQTIMAKHWDLHKKVITFKIHYSIAIVCAITFISLLKSEKLFVERDAFSRPLWGHFTPTVNISRVLHFLFVTQN